MPRLLSLCAACSATRYGGIFLAHQAVPNLMGAQGDIIQTAAEDAIFNHRLEEAISLSMGYTRTLFEHEGTCHHCRLRAQLDEPGQPDTRPGATVPESRDADAGSD